MGDECGNVSIFDVTESTSLMSLSSGEISGKPGVIQNIDVTYIDPPYNQHPYGSNYFMLNLIAENIRPNAVSKVSGIPVDWNRSEYNKKRQALQSFEDLVCSLDSRFLLVSFNSEGFIAKEEMVSLLSKYGTLDILETSYNTFRGSRNLGNRDIHVTEYLYLLEKPGR